MFNPKSFYLYISCLFLVFQACAQEKSKAPNLAEFPKVLTEPTLYNPLNDKEAYVILKKGTEYAFTGAYHDSKKKGTYICRQCNLPLFRSEDKFNSRTGWPSFDDFIGESVTEQADADGRRVEIVCSNCDGHLGHVFKGEGFTEKQTRHCVNSLSLNFVEKEVEE